MSPNIRHDLTILMMDWKYTQAISYCYLVNYSFLHSMYISLNNLVEPLEDKKEPLPPKDQPRHTYQIGYFTIILALHV